MAYLSDNITQSEQTKSPESKNTNTDVESISSIFTLADTEWPAMASIKSDVYHSAH